MKNFQTSNLLASLNESQIKAVEKNDTPLMILAGAGSGKTKTLVTKVVYIMEQMNINPWQILVLTFSNKAAKEAKERIWTTLNPERPQYEGSYGRPVSSSGSPVVTTFHSFCAQILRAEHPYLGLSKNFTIYDEQESKIVASSVLEHFKLNSKETPVTSILAYFEELKNFGFYHDRYKRNFSTFFNKDKVPFFAPTKDLQKLLRSEFYPLFVHYEAELAKSNALDFGSLLTQILKLFETFPEIQKKYQNKFRYILIDEYQDTNRAQFEILLHLSTESNQICVVGDEDQSIYSWRGACIDNILDFYQIFPNHTLLKLEQNYRSTQTIINGAAAVISYNSLRSDKKIWTKNQTGEKIHLIECNSDQSEGEFIADEISSLLKGGVLPNEIAIFYRNNSQSRLIEESLMRFQISYKIIGGIKFYDRKEIKDALSYIKLAVNPNDTIALLRAINSPPRGIGAVTLKKFEDYAYLNSLSLWSCFLNYAKAPHLFSIKLSSKTHQSLLSFVDLLTSIQKMESESISPVLIYKKILNDSQIITYLKNEKTHEAMARIENLQELQSALSHYEKFQLQQDQTPTLTQFLETITLDSSEEYSENPASIHDLNQKENQKRNSVQLMTIHGAKGLEFHYVFVVGAEENLFPSMRALESVHFQKSLEEERRLFYVAMTRAMKKLTITYAQSRMLYGSVRFNDPSRFISEIPSTLVDHKLINRYKWGGSENSSKVSSGSNTSPFSRETPRQAIWATPPKSSSSSFSKKEINNFSSSKITSILQKQNGMKRIEEFLNLTSSNGFQLQMNITHAVYGVGTITKIEGNGEDEVLWITFTSGSTKKFLSKIAPIKIN